MSLGTWGLEPGQGDLASPVSPGCPGLALPNWLADCPPLSPDSQF